MVDSFSGSFWWPFQRAVTSLWTRNLTSLRYQIKQ